MRLHVFNSYLNVIKTDIPISQDKHNIFRKRQFVYRTFVFQSVVIWNKIIKKFNVNVSLVRFKYSLKYFLVFNDITFRYDR